MASLGLVAIQVHFLGMRSHNMIAKACGAGKIKIGKQCYSKRKIETILNIKATEFSPEPIGKILMAMKNDEIVELFNRAQEYMYHGTE